MITRRRFIAGTVGAGLAGAAAQLWAADTPFPDACVTVTRRLAGPAGWAGRRIVFLTDIHYGNYFGPADAAALNGLVRTLRPDLVAMGGDLAQTPDTDLDGFFSAWKPGCPTIFAPGNHDLGTSTRGSVLRQVRAGGITILDNARENWSGLVLVGLPSALRRRQDLALLEAPGLKLVLGHEPDVWPSYAQPDLCQLAGHTHGGQVRLFGRPLALPELGRTYPLGEYTTGKNRALLVSAGIGCMDARVRLNCPPQIIVLEMT
jgi:predicted MPP superfamily phosphohydrolase